MNVFAVDTNVLVYAANELAPEHEPCRRALEEWRKQTGAWYVTWGIWFEFLRVVTHPRVLRPAWTVAKAWDFLTVLMQSPSLEFLVPSPRYASVVRDILRDMPYLAGNHMYDLETAALMRDHGIKTIYTRDTGFHRFRWLDVIDPATAPHGGLHEG